MLFIKFSSSYFKVSRFYPLHLEMQLNLIYADEVACQNRFLEQKLSQFLTESVRDDGIYFLEFDSSYSDWGYVHLPTRCGSSIWGIELSPLIVSCMKKPECSEV